MSFAEAGRVDEKKDLRSSKRFIFLKERWYREAHDSSSFYTIFLCEKMRSFLFMRRLLKSSFKMRF